MKVTSWNIEDDNLVLSYEHEGAGILLRERKGMPGRTPVYEEIALDDETVANLIDALQQLQSLRRRERVDAALCSVKAAI